MSELAGWLRNPPGPAAPLPQPEPEPLPLPQPELQPEPEPLPQPQPQPEPKMQPADLSRPRSPLRAAGDLKDFELKSGAGGHRDFRMTMG